MLCSEPVLSVNTSVSDIYFSFLWKMSENDLGFKIGMPRNFFSANKSLSPVIIQSAFEAAAKPRFFIISSSKSSLSKISRRPLHQIGCPSNRLIINLIEDFETDSIHDRIQCRRWIKELGGKLPGLPNHFQREIGQDQLPEHHNGDP